MRRNEIDFKVKEAKRLMGLRMNQDGFKLVDSVDWWSALVSMGCNIVSTYCLLIWFS